MWVIANKMKVIEIPQGVRRTVELEWSLSEHQHLSV